MRSEKHRIISSSAIQMRRGLLPIRISPRGIREGWNDAFKSNIQCFYDYILEKEAGAHPVPKFVTFEQGLYLLRLTEAVIESSRTGGWVPIPAL